MLRILVTGGAGYIGSHTNRLLADRGHRVVVLDRVPIPDPGLVGAARTIVGDAGDARLLDEIFASERFDAVIHLAGDKAADESMQEPGRYFTNNVGTTIALADAMARAGIGPIVFSSSCAVYGTPVELPVTERAPLQPETPYGASKAMAENVLRWFGLTKGLRWIALRYFNAAGADEAARFGESLATSRNLIPNVMKAALGLGTLTINGTDFPTPDGTAVRDYVHVLDLADVHMRAIEHLLGGGEPDVINIGTGRGASVQEVVAMTREVSGRPVPIIAGPRRPGDPVAQWADNNRAKAVLGWSARHGLREIVDTAWRWHRSEDKAVNA
jgi:UDP-glucose 4-epimerase